MRSFEFASSTLGFIAGNPLADSAFSAVPVATPRTTLANPLQDVSAELWLSGCTVQALEAATRALAASRTVPTCINMAVILETLARYDEALNYRQLAYETDPSDWRAAQSYGEALIRMGRFAEGWPLYYYQRRNLGWLRREIPEWTDQPLAGKRLLLVSYGGAGDNFYFLHGLPFLQKLGAKVFYACRLAMSSLARCLGCIPVTGDDTDTVSLKGYDYFVPIYALGWRLDWSLTNPLWSGPYIKAPLLSRLRVEPRVGFCWRAGEVTSPRKTRFLDQQQISRLQKALPRDYKMENFTGLSGDWLPTVRRLAKLDLLITMDTGIAHLAGAMNIPVWVLLPGGAAWQYPLGFTTHPFYPSMKLFWNRGDGLDSAVDACVQQLKELS